MTSVLPQQVLLQALLGVVSTAWCCPPPTVLHEGGGSSDILGLNPVPCLPSHPPTVTLIVIIIVIIVISGLWSSHSVPLGASFLLLWKAGWPSAGPWATPALGLPAPSQPGTLAYSHCSQEVLTASLALGGVGGGLPCPAPVTSMGHTNTGGHLLEGQGILPSHQRWGQGRRKPLGKGSPPLTTPGSVLGRTPQRLVARSLPLQG